MLAFLEQLREDSLAVVRNSFRDAQTPDPDTAVPVPCSLNSSSFG